MRRAGGDASGALRVSFCLKSAPSMPPANWLTLATPINKFQPLPGTKAYRRSGSIRKARAKTAAQKRLKSFENGTRRYRERGKLVGKQPRSPYPGETLNSREVKERVAGRQGFEPWERSHVQRFSRPPHSTTLPPPRSFGGLRREWATRKRKVSP